MKKLIIGLLILSVAAVAVYAKVLRIDDYSGSLTATAYNNIRADAVSSNDIVITNANLNTKYTGVRGWVYVGAATVSPLDADSITGLEGAKDTAIVTVKTWSGYDEDIIFCDTCADALPCTLFFDYSQSTNGDAIWAGTINADSTEDWTVTGDETQKKALWLDALRIDVQCADSAGAGDTMQFSINYWLRFIEED